MQPVPCHACFGWLPSAPTPRAVQQSHLPYGDLFDGHADQVIWIQASLAVRQTSWRTAIMAMLVLPAPVGAQTSRFSLLVKAVGKMRLWMRFSCLHSSLTCVDAYGVRAGSGCLGFRV